MGLVLQGGGAFGAYEYGAVTRLVELGWHPVAVTGVSIGAATAAAVASAPDGDICRDDVMRSDGAPLSGWRAKSIETFVKIAFA
jgi:predicted acylesterase/phospholipase RssA